jgi:hypothetical protein
MGSAARWRSSRAAASRCWIICWEHRIADGGCAWRRAARRGRRPITEINPHLPAALQARAWAIINDLKRQWPGVRAKTKARPSPFIIARRRRRSPLCAPRSRPWIFGAEWEILSGHMIYEIRSRGQSKGVALGRLMQMRPSPARKPVFAGDDRTDLDGIRAAVELGGAGIAVAGLAAEQARWALKDPTAVRAWLKSLLD